MPTATADNGIFKLTREQLMTLAAGQDSYRFLALALLALPQLPGDVDLRLQVIRHLAALGLIGPAIEFAVGLPAPVVEQLRAAGVLRQLEAVPSGRVPWERLRDQYESNLRVLLTRFPAAGQAAREWDEHHRRLELYQCRDGNWQLASLDAEGRRVWLPRLLDHKAESERAEIAGLADALMPAPYLVKGLGLGWYFARLVRETLHRFLNYSSAIYLLVPSPLELAVALHLHDWRELLGEPRVHIFVGADCGEQFVNGLVSDPELPLPRQNVSVLSIAAGPEVDPGALVERVAEQLGKRYQAVSADVERLYASHDAAAWARRYAVDDPGEPLRVCFLVSRHTTYLKYCIRDLAAAFESRGLRTQVLTEREDHTQLALTTCLETALRFRPDLFFVIDHFRYEYQRLIPAHVPYVGWIQDQLPHLYSRTCGESLGPLDFFIAPDPSAFVHRYGYPASQGLAWTMATDDKTYSDLALPEEELSPHRCDFSYVSNQSRLPADFHDERRKQFASDPATLRLVDLSYEALLQAFRERPDTARLSVRFMLEAIERERKPGRVCEENRQAILRFHLDPLAELMFRQNTLEWVADYCDRTGRRLHLYGKGWEDHPRLAAYARGVADNGRPLRAIYQASAVNLQIIGTGAIHQRLLDGLAAGGFFLIRFTPPDTALATVKRYLAALRRYRPATDADHEASAMPELAEALWELHRFMGHDARATLFRIDPEDNTMLESLEADGFRRLAGAMFPQYGEVSFASAEEFARCADRFLADAEARRTIARAMRGVVVEHYSYGMLVDRLLAFVRRRLREQAEPSVRVSPGQEVAGVLS